MSFTPFLNYVPNSNYVNNNHQHPNFSNKLNDKLIINIKDYTEEDKNLGRGGFGDVFLVKNKNTHKLYAAKEAIGNDSLKIADLINEIKVYSEFNNPTISKIHGYSLVNFKNDPYPVMLIEYMKNGSLASNLDKFRQKKEFRNQFKSKRYNILFGLALALNFLHSKGIIHRDIKPGNILLDDNYYPVICDFGTVLIPNRELMKKQKDEQVGTPYYLAPEIILRNETYTYKTDIYSFSLVAYELLTGYPPFSNYKKSALYNAIRKGERPSLSKVTDPEIQLFFQKCWSNEPNERLNSREIIPMIMKPQFRKVYGCEDAEFIKYMLYLSSNENYKDLFSNCKPAMDSIKYLLGFGVEKSLQKSFDILKNSQSNDDALTTYMLSLNYEMKNDFEKSYYYCKMAADKGNIQAIVDMGDKYLRGIGVPVDFIKSCFYYKKAAKLKSPIGMFNYAFMLYKGRGVQVNKKKAAKYYEMSADLGNANAQYSIARMCDNGDGVPVNYQKAAFYYKKAAAQGDIEAMRNLGLMESCGKIPKDFKTEDYYLKKSVEEGGDKEMILYANSLCYDVMYTKIDEKKKQEMIKKAASYCKQVANKGNVEAMVLYGNMFVVGLLNNDDIDEAIKYSKIAAEDKTVNGMINCGILLLKKDEANINEALKYFQMAADCKDDRGAHLVMILKSFMRIPRRRKINKNFYEGFGSDLYKPNKVDDVKNTKEQKVEDKLKNDSDSSNQNNNAKKVELDSEISSEGKHKKDANNDFNKNGKNPHNNSNNNDDNNNNYSNSNNYNNNNNYNNYNNYSNNNNYNNYNNNDNNDNTNNYNNNYNNGNNNYNNNNNNDNNNNYNNNNNNGNNNYNNNNNNGNNNYNNNNNNDNNNNYNNNNNNDNNRNNSKDDNNCNNYQNIDNKNKKNSNNKINSDDSHNDASNNQKIVNQKNIMKVETKKGQINNNTKPNKADTNDLVDSNNNHHNNAINKVKVNIYQSLKFETNNFICFSQSTIPELIRREIDEYLKFFPCFIKKNENICNPNDPNSFFTFYFYSNWNFDYNTIFNGLEQIFNQYGIMYYQPKFYIDIYFEEAMFPKDELKIFFKHLKSIPGINDILHNIFDGKQVSTYLIVQEGYHKSINE